MSVLNSTGGGSQYTVFKVKTLGWKDDKQVKEIFAKVCNQIQPILTKRKWKVGVLLEFYPSNPALLGDHSRSSLKI